MGLIWDIVSKNKEITKKKFVTGKDLKEIILEEVAKERNKPQGQGDQGAKKIKIEV